MELRPHLLTAARACGIRSLIGTTRFLPVGPFQCSTPTRTYGDASPKAVSERTSYSQIRLAFHSLPQVIPTCCTTYGFGPPSVFRQTSPCSWQAHLASGRIYPTRPCSRKATGTGAIHARFPLSSIPEGFSYARYTHSPAHSSIGMPSPKPHFYQTIHCHF